MSFKVKSRKKILSDARVTLDAKHNEDQITWDSFHKIQGKERELYA